MNLPSEHGVPAPHPAAASGFMLTECLVYISLVLVLLGAGYLAMYRCIDNSLVLRRNADDIVLALRTGERWRAEVRKSDGALRLETTPISQTLRLTSDKRQITYRFETNALSRRVDQGPWAVILDRVAASRMETDPRRTLTAWRWELELQPRAKGVVKASRIRPLFTFLAAPPTAPNP